MEQNDNIYLTKDIHEAAWLLQNRLELRQLIAQQNNSSVYYFCFENREDSEKLANEFWNKKATGNIKEYAESLRTLKDRLFARKR